MKISITPLIFLGMATHSIHADMLQFELPFENNQDELSERTCIGNIIRETEQIVEEILDRVEVIESKVCGFVSQFDECCSTIEDISSKVDIVESHVEIIESKVCGFSSQFDGCCSVIENVDSKIDIIESHVEIIESKVCEIASLIDEPDLCAPTPITEPGTISIPGTYCLANDIVGQIVIDADRVTLDLNGKSISGGNPTILVQNRTGIIIKNGIIFGSGTAITIDPSNNVKILQIDFTSNGIALAVNDTNGIIISNCTFRDHSLNVLNFINVHNGVIKNCLFENNNNITSSPISIINIESSDCLVFKNIEICSNQESFNGVFYGIIAFNSTELDFIQCKVSGNSNLLAPSVLASIFGFGFINCTDITLHSCEANDNQSIFNAVGFQVEAVSSIDTTSEKIIFDSCIANLNSSLLVVAGFNLFTCTDCCLFNCIAKQNTSATTSVGQFALGISLSTSVNQATVKNCIVKANTAQEPKSSFGIVNNGTTNVLFNNESQGHGNSIQNLSGIMPKITYDTTTGQFFTFDTSVLDTPCHFDNIDVQP